MRKFSALIVGLLGFVGAAAGRAESVPDRACFARELPADIRTARLDDVKLLIGWVFDAAAAHRKLVPGAVIDRDSGLGHVPGFAGATDLGALAGRYRIVEAPFDKGHGYFGVALGALDADGKVTGLFLINRLFRLPLLAQQPAGVLTDIMTNGAMLTGLKTAAITEANEAASIALSDAQLLRVPLLMAGQSQAGGVAQLQAAYLVKAYPERAVATGFVTLNAAYVVASIRRLGLAPEQVEGINFVKDLDPGFGPHGLLPNRIGLQVFIHPDGTGSGKAGDESVLAALGHPGQHLLAEFDQVSLTQALAATLAAAPDLCVHPI